MAKGDDGFKPGMYHPRHVDIIDLELQMFIRRNLSCNAQQPQVIE